MRYSPRQFSLLVLLAITGGIALFLAAVGPMFAALVVSNRLIDDGPHPGDRAIMDQWDAWGFSLKNWGLLAMGLLLMILGIFSLRRAPKISAQQDSVVDSCLGSLPFRDIGEIERMTTVD
jgi:hypothetical protein